MNGGERSARARAEALLRDAIRRVGLDAVRRDCRPKRASGEYQYVPSDYLDPALRPPLRRCLGCNAEMIEGSEPRSRMGPEQKCRTCLGVGSVLDPPSAA